MINGTYSTMREEVSKPYHLILEPAMRRIKYLLFRIRASAVDNNSALEGTDL